MGSEIPNHGPWLADDRSKKRREKKRKEKQTKIKTGILCLRTVGKTKGVFPPKGSGQTTKRKEKKKKKKRPLASVGPFHFPPNAALLPSQPRRSRFLLDCASCCSAMRLFDEVVSRGMWLECVHPFSAVHFPPSFLPPSWPAVGTTQLL